MANPGSSPPSAQAEAMMQAFLNGPVHQPPYGIRPNFSNSANINDTVYSVLSICIAISTLSALIHSYTKFFMMRAVHYEEYAILLAWIGHVGSLIPSLYCIFVGGGKHMWDLRLREFFKLLYWFNITAILYGIIIALVKIAILLRIQRIFLPQRQTNMPLFVAIQVTTWSILVFYSVDTIFEIIMCLPRKKIWSPLMETGYCFNANAAYIATGMFNVISDFTILTLPIAPIWKLRLPFKKKMMMLAIFTAGGVACVMSIMRTYYTFRIVQSPDVSYNTIVMGMWISAEVAAGMLVYCLPIMPKFFQHYGSKIYASTVRYKSGSYHTKGVMEIVPRGPPYNRQAGDNSKKSLFQNDSGDGQNSDPWVNSFDCRAIHISHDVTIENDIEAPLPKPETRFDWPTTATEVYATRRQDLGTRPYVLRKAV